MYEPVLKPEIVQENQYNDPASYIRRLMKWLLCRTILKLLVAAPSYVILAFIVIFIVIFKFYVHIPRIIASQAFLSCQFEPLTLQILPVLHLFKESDECDNIKLTQNQEIPQCDHCEQDELQ